MFIDVSGCFGKNLGTITINNAGDFALFLLESCKIAVVPGEAFGIDHYIRISYAASMEQLEVFIQRLKDSDLNQECE